MRNGPYLFRSRFPCRTTLVPRGFSTVALSPPCPLILKFLSRCLSPEVAEALAVYFLRPYI